MGLVQSHFPGRLERSRVPFEASQPSASEMAASTFSGEAGLRR